MTIGTVPVMQTHPRHYSLLIPIERKDTTNRSYLPVDPFKRRYSLKLESRWRWFTFAKREEQR